MDHFAGLDVSVKETSVCIVDDTGKIIREAKVASERGPTSRVRAKDRGNRCAEQTKVLTVQGEIRKDTRFEPPMAETVLVVDDEPLVLEVTASMLEVLGWAVITAESGKPSQAMRH
jgi:hypothetical protein